MALNAIPVLITLLLAVPAAAAAQDPAPSPHTGWLTAQQATPSQLDIPQPPRAVGIRLPKHAMPPLPAGTGTLPQPECPPSQSQLAGTAAPAAGQFTYFLATDAKPDTAWSSVVTEPSVAINRDTAFQTGNWYAGLSKDSGVSWSLVNPFTLFSAADGGFCCDQKTIHIASHDATVWLLQYSYSSTTQSGRHRIAWANGRSALRNSAWNYYDLTPQFFGFGNHWLDFPDLAMTTTHVYGTTNVFTPGGANVDSILWRAELNDFVNGGSTNFAWYLRSGIGSVGSFRFSASVTPTMYAASHLTLASLRAYRWGAGNITWTDVTVPLWAQGTKSVPGPDGRDWAGFDDGRILAGYAGSAEYGFLWSSSPIAGRARPFTRVARIRTSDNTLIAAEDIWSASEAFLYPAAATNAFGNIGFTVANGSSTIYPRTVAAIVDGYAPNFFGQTLWAAGNGTHGPDRNRWGDYFAVAQHPTFGGTFVSIGKRQVGGPADGNAEPQFLWFGRDDFTPTWLDLAVNSSPVTGIPITVDETDRFGRKDGTTNFTRSFPARQGYTLTAPFQHVAGGLTYEFNVWILNGAPLTPGQRTLIVDDIGNFADTAEASYVALRTLNVDSTPTRGEFITVSLADRNGQLHGVTAFNRSYADGATVNLTAPNTAGGTYLRRWYVNGAPMPPRQLTISVLMDRTVTAVADYGGVFGTGPDWTDITAASPTPPPARIMHAMAYDPVRDKCVLFGGSTDGSSAFDDTWELSGINVWQNMGLPSPRPSARMGHSMVYADNLARTIVFGGRINDFFNLNDTWTWNGSVWSNLAPSNPPPARAFAAMTYVPSVGGVLLYGGLGFFTNGDDTWLLNTVTATWTQLTPATRPPPLVGASLCWDKARNRAVLTGRNSASTEQEIWEFDFTNWTRRNTTPGPVPRGGDAIAYDGLRKRTVLFAGGWSGIGTQNDTWEWNGTTWTERIPLNVPSRREWHAVAWDTRRLRMVLFAGYSGSGPLGDTWLYAYPCDVVGPGHPGGGLPITCTTTPRIGTSFCVQFPAATGTGALLVGLRVPLDPPLPVFPALFCAQGSLYTAGDVVLNTAGHPATKCIPVPLDLALLWGAFTLQGVAVDPAGCVRLTDGLVFVLQP